MSRGGERQASCSAERGAKYYQQYRQAYPDPPLVGRTAAVKKTPNLESTPAAAPLYKPASTFPACIRAFAYWQTLSAAT
jgi:hypothetical protein